MTLNFEDEYEELALPFAAEELAAQVVGHSLEYDCLLYTSPSPRDTR